MNLPAILKRAIKIVELNDSAIKSVSKDPSATGPAVLIIAISSFAGAIGSLLFPVKYGPVTYRPTLMEAIGHALIAILFVLAVVYLLHLIANHLFKAHGDYVSLLRVVGHGYVIGFLNIFPALSVLVLLWMLVMQVRILKDIKRLTTENAVIAMILTGIVVFVFLALFQDLNADNLYGGLYLVPYK